MWGKQTDDTSTSFVNEKFFRDFLEGRVAQPGQVHFPENFQLVAAEMNRRLMRSQEKVANSLNRATWVLSIFTVVLALATALPLLPWLCHRP